MKKKPAKNKNKVQAAPTAKAEVASKTHWPVHPIALLFPPKPPEERAELKEDMKRRAAAGLPPLENAILKYENQILDGRHRDELWKELAEENGGYFKKNLPPTEEFAPVKDGNLSAWLRAKSRNLVVRQLPADQRGAIFLKAVETYPELRAVLDQIKTENLQRQKEGKPLVAGGQRGNTAKQIADLAGVGTTSIKEAQQLKKVDPEKFEEVVKGKTTTKKALREVREKKTDANSVKGERPKIADLAQIIHRGLGEMREVERLGIEGNAVYFWLNGHQIKVTCKIVEGS